MNRRTVVIFVVIWVVLFVWSWTCWTWGYWCGVVAYDRAMQEINDLPKGAIR